jgi:hypothetical protein
MSGISRMALKVRLGVAEEKRSRMPWRKPVEVEAWPARREIWSEKGFVCFMSCGGSLECGFCDTKRMGTVTTRSWSVSPCTLPTPGHTSLARTPYSILAKSGSSGLPWLLVCKKLGEDRVVRWSIAHLWATRTVLRELFPYQQGNGWKMDTCMFFRPLALAVLSRVLAGHLLRRRKEVRCLASDGIWFDLNFDSSTCDLCGIILETVRIERLRLHEALWKPLESE